ncbi:MAG: DUF2442 domain-containing protein [Candidatus Eremiobacteraeota bacterium]|nr:DUF2442 domain-containing protein [Candidatus Eremiobacteraeota bacterium]
MKTRARAVSTDAEIDAAIARGKAAPGLTAIEASYDRTFDKVRISFDDGMEVSFPRLKLQGLEIENLEQLEKIEIEGAGTSLYWPRIDVGHYIPGLLQGVFGSRAWMAKIGSRGGSVSTIAKAAAARANGKKGGRPPLALTTVAGKALPRVAYAKKSTGGGGRKKRKS